MSYDFATLKVCSHQIVDEIVTLESGTSIFFRLSRTLANTEEVTIKIDDITIPKSGLYSYATVPCSKPGPYRIMSGVNDLLQYKIGNDSTLRTMVLNPGNSISASDMAFDIASKSDSSLTTLVKNNRVVLSSPTPVNGKHIYIPDPRIENSDPSVVLPTTERALRTLNTLGISIGRVGSGSLVYPGWEIIKNRYSPLGETIIQFSWPILNYSPIITASYITLAQNCGRCLGSKVEYDYNISGKSLETVRNTDLLLQESDKFMFTELGSHFKWPWLGSKIASRVGSKANPGNLSSSALVSVDINSSFSTYQNIKRQQATLFPYQNVTDSEFPAALVSATTESSPTDPTIVLANLVISSASTEYVPVTRVVTLPDPFSVTSDPSGLLQQASTGFMVRG
jgi:hypothetical protein